MEEVKALLTKAVEAIDKDYLDVAEILLEEALNRIEQMKRKPWCWP